MLTEIDELDDKKYIVHVMGYDSKKYGALEEYTINLALKARLQGIEVILIYNKQPRSTVFINKLQTLKIKYYISNALSIVDFWGTFNKITKKYKPILVHSHFQPLLPSIYGWILGYRYRWNTIRLMLVDKSIREAYSKSDLKLSSRIYRYLINSFTNRYFCVSNAVYNQYKLIYPSLKNISVLYNGASVSFYNREKARKDLGFISSTIYICSIAFSSRTKGTDILIRAFNHFIRKYKKTDIKLCLIGLDKESALTKELLLMIDNYNLNDKVINFGIINNVQEVLPAMDIYVQPSRSESLSNAIIEAGLFRIPAIGSNVGGIPEVIHDGETGFLFPYEDYKTLAQKINLLVKDEILRNKMGNNAQKHILNNFTMDNKIDELISYYKNVI